MRASSELLIRAIAPTDELRIAAVITTEVVREAARRHELSPLATVAMGRALTSGLLLATMTKGEERVTLQLVGNGPLGSITVDADAHGDVRGYVKHTSIGGSVSSSRTPIGAALGRDGVVNLTRDLGLRELYQGQVELTNGEVDEDVEAYLRISEQVPSALSCEVLLDEDGHVLRAAGLLIQALPGGTADVITLAQHRLRTGALHALLRQGDIEAQAIIEALTPSEPVEMLSNRAVRFQCRCSEERIRTTLQLLTITDLDEMIAEGKPAEVICNFCNQRYEIGLEELERLRTEREPREAN
jgi:molecular chaperone Hsp33